ncbi:MAG: hypothetical protein JSU08_09040 [Acidobacteria bacterium]|nr:hypothetical protein [Acidobacteriota bacterium]
MPTSVPRAQTIDQVIDRLDTLVRDCVAAGSRLGYFAALYNRVTRAVRDRIDAGGFDDNPRMARLDVVFANRYLDAWDDWHAGRPTSRSWQVAFDAGARTDLSVLQHLILGMNAHINFDLGLAVVEVAPGDRILPLHDDFVRINDVLGAELPAVESVLRQISPCLDRLSEVADRLDNLDDRFGMFSVAEARNAAWRFALRLNALDTSLGRTVAVTARDAVVTEVACHFAAPGLTALLGGADAVDTAAHLRLFAAASGTPAALA